MCVPFVLMVLSMTTSARNAESSNENEAIVVGATVEANDLWLSGMNLCVRKDRPATMMGMVRCTNQPRTFTYVFIVKRDEERTYVPTWKSEPNIVGRTGKESSYAEVGGQRIEFSYSIELDTKGKALPKETLVINNVRTDPKGGRVFLIDCSGREVIWQQLDLRLPVPPPLPANPADVDALSERTVKDLKAESAAVREFLRKD
jgi:hypothetical protein